MLPFVDVQQLVSLRGGVGFIALIFGRNKVSARVKVPGRLIKGVIGGHCQREMLRVCHIFKAVYCNGDCARCRRVGELKFNHRLIAVDDGSDGLD